MKTSQMLLTAGAVALGLSLVNLARADEALLSPRAKDNQIRQVAGTNKDRNLVTGDYRGAAGKLDALVAKVVPGTAQDPILVTGTYAGAGLKNPYAGPAPFEIAPLVGGNRK
jgi:hypothetical protein